MSRRFVSFHMRRCRECQRARSSVRARGCWNVRGQLLGLQEQVRFLMRETASRLRAFGVNATGMSLATRMKKLVRLTERAHPAAAAKKVFRERMREG